MTAGQLPYPHQKYIPPFCRGVSGALAVMAGRGVSCALAVMAGRGVSGALAAMAGSSLVMRQSTNWEVF